MAKFCRVQKILSLRAEHGHRSPEAENACCGGILSTYIPSLLMPGEYVSDCVAMADDSIRCLVSSL